MPDVYDQNKRSTVMRAVHSSHTKPEAAVQQALNSLGYDFHLHRQDLPGKPDIVLPEHRKIIFVHGCFWHQHPGCKAAARPQSNIDYWNKKLDRNSQRDKEHIAMLEASSWEVLIVWECETRNQELLRQTLTRFIENNNDA
ncbi:MAG TPA: DNA mismatch endonuclease Vsr [Ktedonobacteraceae bacterium]|nr:DNA mismatch endonuclease Vsr [Ktedonobacteraceae bacterium]